MSERISNKKQNFDGIDPQESLIKSLESIKSLLKQGDSKISEARENIARADNISNDTIENRLSHSNSKIAKPMVSDTTQKANKKPSKLESATDHQLTELKEITIEAEFEDSKFKTDIAIPQKLHKSNTQNQLNTSKAPQKDKTGLNDIYDHDLIVPMLDEIVMPEDEDSDTALFNMDSASEIELETTAPLLDLNNFNKVTKADANKSEQITSNKSKELKVENDNIDKVENSTNADIISFELNSSKKNNIKKLEKHTSEVAKSKSNNTTIKKSETVVDKQDKQNKTTKPALDQVVIKETTDMIDITMPLANAELAETELKSKTDSTLDLTPDLTKAIENSVYTDDILSSISSSNTNEKTVSENKVSLDKVNLSSKEKSNDTKQSKQDQFPVIDNVSLSNASNKNAVITSDTATDVLSDEIDFTSIEGLNTLKFNADKMSSLQKRIEKRVHNRLIQLIVQLDDEIKSIFTDEIKNCVAHEAKNNKS